MKFNKERWRTLAENKPDELHSYIPQSSISELFDERERLEKVLEQIILLDLKPYENEYFYGANKLKMISYEGLKSGRGRDDTHEEEYRGLQAVIPPIADEDEA